MHGESKFAVSLFLYSYEFDKILSACAQTLFALRTLKHHGLSTDALQTIFQATVIAKLSYASQPGGVSQVQQTKTGWTHFCVGLLSLATVQPLHPPLPTSVPPRYRLLNCVTRNPRHLLHPLLPPSRDEHYNLRRRSNHNL